MYQSITMGNFVDTRREVIAQVFESLFRFHALDLRWKKWEGK